MVCLLTTFQEETIGCTDGKCCNLKKKKNNLNFTNNNYLFIFFLTIKKNTIKSASFIIRVGRVKARAHSNWHKAVVVLCQLDWQSY